MSLEISKEEAMSQRLRHVIVKFIDDIHLPYTEGAEAHFNESGIGKYFTKEQLEQWQSLELDRFGITLSPLFADAEEFETLLARAKEYNPDYQPPNFLSYFTIKGKMEQRTELNELADILQAQEGLIETAYLDPIGVEPYVTAVDNPEFVNQGYLLSAADSPPGIDAQYAWNNGVTGEEIQIVDLERAWAVPHADLIQTQQLFGNNWGPVPEHGINVLGILGAVDNLDGCVGICPEISMLGLTSHSGDTRPNAVKAVLTKLNPGDILLLEVQLIDVPGPYNGQWLPMETVRCDFHIIELATNLQITVIEAAGNGGLDLDRVRDKLVDHPQYAHLEHDSKAVMVGAASVTWENYLMRWQTQTDGSNYGSRVNCFAWGNGIRTLSTNDGITGMSGVPDFGGTSGASAIVAGAAALIQSYTTSIITPEMMRELLSDFSNTQSNDPGVDRIGVMPDLKNILSLI